MFYSDDIMMVGDKTNKITLVTLSYTQLHRDYYLLVINGHLCWARDAGETMGNEKRLFSLILHASVVGSVPPSVNKTECL